MTPHEILATGNATDRLIFTRAITLTRDANALARKSNRNFPGRREEILRASFGITTLAGVLSTVFPDTTTPFWEEAVFAAAHS